jgi:hypothetical protein
VKKNIIQLLSWSLFLVITIAIVNIALATRPRGDLQANSEAMLEQRLVDLDLPVRSFSVIKKSPLEVEVILDSAGNENDQSVREDLWDRCIAERELDLAYLNYDLRIASYHLKQVTVTGDVHYSSTSFLNPGDPYQKLTPAPPSAVDNQQTKELVKKDFDWNGLALLELDVPEFVTERENSQLLTMHLSTGTSGDEVDEEQITLFIWSVRFQIEAINAQYGTNIALVRVLIADTDENPLVEYFEDLLTGRSCSWHADSLEGTWYPQPAPIITGIVEETSEPIESPTPAPPAVTSTPDRDAYPPPQTPSPYP